MRPRLFVLAIVILVACVDCRAAIIGENSLTIDLTNSEDANKKAVWSEPDKISIDKHGLGWSGSARSSRDAWFRTKPLGIGISWRPVTQTRVSVKISPDAKAVSQSNIESTGNVFVRYSPDRKHWSGWQALIFQPSSPKKDPRKLKQPLPMSRTFHGRIAVPRIVREPWNEKVREFWKLDVPWRSDEEAIAKWVLKSNPRFFEEHRPFVGYVQFLYETSLHGGRRLSKFEARLTWVVSGSHVPPKDKAAYKNRDDIPWRFRAE